MLKPLNCCYILAAEVSERRIKIIPALCNITSASVGEYSRDISSVYHLSCEWDSNPSQVSFIDLR